MIPAEAVARKIAEWIGYKWEGLSDHSVVDRGFPEWVHGGTIPYQGGKPDLLRFAAEIVRVSEELQWTVGSVPPPVPEGSEGEFILAVYRAGSDKVYSFAASYLNQYPLRYDDSCPKGDGCEGIGCDDGCPTTGWFILVGDDGSDSGCYQQLTLSEGDRVQSWREVPQWKEEYGTGARTSNEPRGS